MCSYLYGNFLTKFQPECSNQLLLLSGFFLYFTLGIVILTADVISDMVISCRESLWPGTSRLRPVDNRKGQLDTRLLLGWEGGSAPTSPLSQPQLE